MRPEKCQSRRTQRVKKSGFIEKLYTYPDRKSRPSSQIFEKNNTELQSIVSDGGLGAGFCRNSNMSSDQRDSVLYSLNKRKRWMLPGLLEDAIDEDLSDKRFSVSCLVRTTLPVTSNILRSYGYPLFKGPWETVAVSLAMHSATDATSESDATFESPDVSTESTRMTSKHPNRPSDLSDLVIKVNQYQKVIDGMDRYEKQNFVSVQADFGIMYHVGVPPQRDVKKRPQERAKARQNPANRCRNFSNRLGSLPSIPVDLTEYEEFTDDDSINGCTTPEESARRSYDFAELLDRNCKRIRRRNRNRRSCYCSNLQIHPVLVNGEGSWETNETVEIVSVASQLDKELETEPQPDDFSSVRVRAADESQRTFLFQKANLHDLKIILEERRQPLMELLVNNEIDSRVTFIDIGFANAIVLLAKPTFFGLEVTLKGPPQWLLSLPEFTVLSDLYHILPLRGNSLKKVNSPNNLENLLNFQGENFRFMDLLSGIFCSSDGREILPMFDKTPAPCPICCEDYDVLLRNSCGHTACASCWKLHFVAKVSEGKAKVNCMIPSCGVQIEPAIIGLTAPWHTVEAWQNRNVDVMVTSRQGKYCPGSRCTTVFLPDSTENSVTDKDQNEMSLCHCPNCSKRFCWTCKEEWHWPCPCPLADSYRLLMMSRDDDPWLRYNKKHAYLVKTKRCPSCKLPVEKGLGCNHMTCNCGESFCWLCGRSYEAHEVCFEKAMDIVNVEDGALLNCKEEAYNSAVEWRNRRHGLRRLTKIDSEMKTVLFFLYHIMEYMSAFESQLPISRWKKFKCKTLVVDMLFLCDMLLIHFDDENRALYIERAGDAILRLEVELRDIFSNASCV